MCGANNKKKGESMTPKKELVGMLEDKSRFIEIYQERLRENKEAAVIRKYPDKFEEGMPWSNRALPPLNIKDRFIYFLTSPGFLFVLVIGVLIALLALVILFPPELNEFEGEAVLVACLDQPLPFNSLIKAGITSNTSPTIP